MRTQDAWPQESGFPAEHCFVIEDASSGLLLTRAGEMAVLSVARLNGQARLDEAVADLVVPSLDDVATL
jgi:beta-phosphoglucomutase-like phosphatase (HAD superfamily)